MQQGLTLLLWRDLLLGGLGLLALSALYAAFLYGAHRSKDPLVRSFYGSALRLVSVFYYTIFLLILFQGLLNLFLGKSLQDRSLLGHYLEEATLRRQDPRVEAGLQATLSNLQAVFFLRSAQGLGGLCQLTGDPSRALVLLGYLLVFHFWIRRSLDGWILGARPLPAGKGLGAGWRARLGGLLGRGAALWGRWTRPGPPGPSA